MALVDEDGECGEHGAASVAAAATEDGRGSSQATAGEPPGALAVDAFGTFLEPPGGRVFARSSAPWPAVESVAGTEGRQWWPTVGPGHAGTPTEGLWRSGRPPAGAMIQWSPRWRPAGGGQGARRPVAAAAFGAAVLMCGPEWLRSLPATIVDDKSVAGGAPADAAESC